MQHFVFFSLYKTMLFEIQTKLDSVCIDVSCVMALYFNLNVKIQNVALKQYVCRPLQHTNWSEWVQIDTSV